MNDQGPTILHNPRCSKSREALKLLRENGPEPKIIEYLKNPPSAAQLDDILRRLALEPRELIRTQEPEYQTAGLENPELDRQSLIEAMVRYPKLIERPIVIVADKAIVGRPPERVLELL